MVLKTNIYLTMLFKTIICHTGDIQIVHEERHQNITYIWVWVEWLKEINTFSFYVFVNEYMYDTSVNKYPETDRRKIGITMLEKIVLNLYGRGMKFYN